jgi:hypothetical protein
MVNDILEQLAEDYFREKGYFTQHNIKYKPDTKGLDKKEVSLYSVHSDIDIIGVHPKKSGNERVIVVSCKSWQGGQRLKHLDRLNQTVKNNDFKNKDFKIYRELLYPIWSKALINKVFELTGQKSFIFYLALTRYIGSESELKKWEEAKIFKKNLKKCEIKLINLKTMISHIQDEVGSTPAHSELSRLIQLIKADKGYISYDIIKKANKLRPFV